MAKVTQVTRNSPRTFKVILTEGEVDFLLGLTAFVHGDRATTPAKYADRIAEALEKAAGYSFEDADAFWLGEGVLLMHEYEDLSVTPEE